MKEVSPMKAIRQKCLDCSCGSSEEVKNCFAKKCPLYQFRFGYKLDENEFRQQLDGYMYNIPNESLFSGVYYMYASCRNCNGLYK